MNYRWYRQYDKYELVELPTNHIIWNGDSEKEAKTKCRRLNMGYGFDGFTPAFFMNRLIPSE